MRLRCNHTYQTSKRSVSKKDIFVVSYEIKTKQLGKPDKKLQNKTTSHSAYDETSTESNGVKIYGFFYPNLL